MDVGGLDLEGAEGERDLGGGERGRAALGPRDRSAALSAELETLRVDAFLCQICQAREITHVLVPCGHTLCGGCLGRIVGQARANQRRCPFDRQLWTSSVPFRKPGALDGTSMVPILDGQEDTGWTKTASFSQSPRCTNTSKSKEPPYLGTRDPCIGVPANEFTHMGYSLRTADWR